MAVEVVLVPETEQDISGAYAWYEDLRLGPGAEFLWCVDACIGTIVRMPLMQKAGYENTVGH